jgi:general secretion pathway protein I
VKREQRHPQGSQMARHCVRPFGFTLIEVLVALAIISVALMAALRAAGQGTASATELRNRLLAGWIAENRLAEYRARETWLPLGIRRGSERQAGIEYTLREEITATPNPAFRRVDVFVYGAQQESHALAHLAGFIVLPTRGTP